MPGTEMNKAALGVDIRSGQSFKELERVLSELDEAGLTYEILFLESSDDVLIKRLRFFLHMMPPLCVNRIAVLLSLCCQRLSTSARPQ